MKEIGFPRWALSRDFDKFSLACSFISPDVITRNSSIYFSLLLSDKSLNELNPLVI